MRIPNEEIRREFARIIRKVKNAETALDQIRKRHYPDALKGIEEPILLVGISYDKEDKEKKHHCRIEMVDG